MFPVVRLHSRMRLQTLSPCRAEIHRSTGSAESNDLRPHDPTSFLLTVESFDFGCGRGEFKPPSLLESSTLPDCLEGGLI